MKISFGQPSCQESIPNLPYFVELQTNVVSLLDNFLNSFDLHYNSIYVVDFFYNTFDVADILNNHGVSI